MVVAGVVFLYQICFSSSSLFFTVVVMGEDLMSRRMEQWMKLLSLSDLRRRNIYRFETV